MIDGGAAFSGQICPYLGIAEDSGVRRLGVSPFHRCHRGERPRTVGQREQATYCLSGDYEECPRWNPIVRESRLDRIVPPFAWERDGVRELLGQAIRFVFVGAIGASWLALGVAAIILLGPLLGAANSGSRGAPAAFNGNTGSSDSARAGLKVDSPVPAALIVAMDPSPTAAAPAGTAVPSPGRASAAAAAVVPVPSPTATVRAVQRPEITPVPAGGVYVVKAKDTLFSIARAHGVSVDDLMKANGLKDRNYVRTGQKLTIPPPPR